MTHIKASLFFSRRCLHSFFSIHLELLLRLHPYYGIPVLSLFLKTASSQFQEEREIENEWVYNDAFSFLFFISLLLKQCIPWTGDPVVLSAQFYAGCTPKRSMVRHSPHHSVSGSQPWDHRHFV